MILTLFVSLTAYGTKGQQSESGFSSVEISESSQTNETKSESKKEEKKRVASDSIQMKCRRIIRIGMRHSKKV